MIKGGKQNMEQFNKLITKINEKNPYYLLIGVLFLILIVDYLVIMQFQLRTLGSLNPKIKTLSEELSGTKNNIQRLSQYEDEIKKLNRQLGRFIRRVKGKEEIPQALENISVIANKNGVKIEQIMPDTSTNEPVLQNSEGQYFIIPVIIEAKAGYHNFGRFLNQMEEEGVFLNVADFTLAANLKEGRLHTIKLTVDTIVLEPREAARRR